MTTITPHDEACMKAVHPTQLKEELAGMTIRALQKRAEEIGVDEDKLDDAEEKSDIISLILTTMASVEDGMAEEIKWKKRNWRVIYPGCAGPIDGGGLDVPTEDLCGRGTLGQSFQEMLRQLYPLRDDGTDVDISVSGGGEVAIAVWSMGITVNHQFVRLTSEIHTDNWVTMMMDKLKADRCKADEKAVAAAENANRAIKKAAAYNRRMARRAAKPT